MRAIAAIALASFLPASMSAGTLHGRIKDQSCVVMSQVTVKLRPLGTLTGMIRTLQTDDGGNYTVDLPAGEYQLCVVRGAHAAPTCTTLVLAGAGDAWITTQLRDTAPDLSSFGNRTY